MFFSDKGRNIKKWKFFFEVRFLLIDGFPIQIETEISRGSITFGDEPTITTNHYQKNPKSQSLPDF